MDPVWISVLASVIGCATSVILVFLLRALETYLRAHGANDNDVQLLEQEIHALSLSNVSTPVEFKSSSPKSQ